MVLDSLDISFCLDKASSDAASRPTLYPKERHHVYQVDWQNALFQGTYDFQVQSWFHPNSLVRFYGNFHVIHGHDAADADVNDIPPSRLIGGIEYGPVGKRWMGSFEIVNQFKKNDPGPDEFVRDAAVILNAKTEFTVWKQLKFRVAGLNLTNETYYDSADNRAPLAIGRAASIELLAGF